MMLYDDRTKDALKAENKFIFPEINVSDDITFKASYIISGDLHCAGKVSALRSHRSYEKYRGASY